MVKRGSGRPLLSPPRLSSPGTELAEHVFRETVFVFISVQYILRVLSETEAIVYSKLLMRTEQEKEGPREGRGLGAPGGEWSRGARREDHSGTVSSLLSKAGRVPERKKARRGTGLSKITGS